MVDLNFKKKIKINSSISQIFIINKILFTEFH